MKTVAFYTLGCRVNQYETEAVGELFQKAGYSKTGFQSPADVYVINTCTVTGESDRKSRQMIRRAKHKNPAAVVVVMGCFSQINPKEAAALEGVDVVLGTKHRDRAVLLVEKFLKTGMRQEAVQIHGDDAYEALELSNYAGKTRAHIKIQEGCEQFCTYCIIPYARGKLKSRPEDDVVAEAMRLAEAGFSEIVLTGIHMASYGRDRGRDDLLSLLQKLDRIEGIRRIRLGSLEPNVMDFDFVRRAAKLEKLCEHFHISLQSGCDATLLRMNRKYTAQKYREYIDAIRENMPDCAITTDLMVGFPGETEEEFLESYRFAKSMRFSHIHTFIYSRRKNTPAADFPGQIPQTVKKERSKKMIALSEESRMEFLEKYPGRTLEVLFEQIDADGWAEGYTRNYQKVKVFAPVLKGALLDVKILCVEQDALIGELI